MAKTSFAPNPAKIKVIGIGGGGCNAVTRMVQEEIQGVDFIGINTDAQALLLTEAPIRIQIGEKMTKGLGVGGDHIAGAKAAEQSRDELKECISDADMVFLAAGMGGGTGTGAMPFVAEMAKEAGALTIAVVTKPFAFEGAHRSQVAEEGIERVLGKVDTLIIIPNDRLLSLCDNKTAVGNAFRMADDALRHGVQAIAEVITVPGMINLDFADVKAVMKDAGPAWMSIGIGSGQNRAANAAKAALDSPLLDVFSVEGSTGVLFNIAGGDNLTLFEVNEAAQVIREAVDPNANIIFGVVFDPQLDADVRITLICTGFTQVPGDGPRIRKDEDLRHLLEGADSEHELDIPTFLRQRPTARRQATEAAAPKQSLRSRLGV